MNRSHKRKGQVFIETEFLRFYWTVYGFIQQFTVAGFLFAFAGVERPSAARCAASLIYIIYIYIDILYPTLGTYLVTEPNIALTHPSRLLRPPPLPSGFFRFPGSLPVLIREQCEIDRGFEGSF